MRDRKKLKIAVFHLAFIYSGGGEKLVLKEVDGLSKMGYSVDVYTCCLNTNECFPDQIKKYKIKEFLPGLKFFLKGHESFQVLLSCILAPLYVFRFRKYDLIFAANQPSLWIAYICKLFLKKKYIAYLAQPTRFLYPRKIDKVTGLFFNKKESESFSVELMKLFKLLVNKFDQLSIKKADIVLVNGEYMTKRIATIYKIKTINCPAGANFIKNPISDSFKSKNRYIMMTNRHAWQKRLEYGITVFSSIIAKYPEYKIVITGKESEYTQELKLMVKRLGLDQKVVFAGLLDATVLEEKYKYASIYLYTAPEEDYGMGIVEAMGQGVPVVAWNKCGPSKIIINNKTGFLVDPNNIEEFVSKVLELVENKKLRLKMSQTAIDLVKNSYSWKKHYSIIDSSINNLVLCMHE